MSIEILPARLANQIAAGEVVERPASVVKELVENSLDAGATAIKIDIEKGGAKRICISDNGKGIVKEELTLALSRHATSKIKNLNDLEGISSLGFRGEALASISSVARLTLTSKPKEQDNAWQACAFGRDMDVTVQPAAHPNGTTIDVVDLFFNTPARRKFLRTEKTEFAHIEEVIKRIALATFNVAFTLTHNGKVIRQYRLATTKAQYAKRVAQVCGQSFIENALEVDCQHEGLQLSGWIGLPSYFRKQNDLCYSYVNGRMMRDKLINHAIRQAYNEMLPAETYPAFVLFLQLDVRDVDVNVHPAKHEVRFHQGRYVHDFIYSVCHQALQDNSTAEIVEQVVAGEVEYVNQERDYVKPLAKVSESYAGTYKTSANNQYQATKPTSAPIAAVHAYNQLITPLANEKELITSSNVNEASSTSEQFHLQFVAPAYGACVVDGELRLVSLAQCQVKLNERKMADKWQNKLVSQPLLLPVKLELSVEQVAFIQLWQDKLEQLGVILQLLDNAHVQIRQFPAVLRHQDVTASFVQLIKELEAVNGQEELDDSHWQKSFTKLMSKSTFDEFSCQQLWLQMKNVYQSSIKQELCLNSTKVDLTSAIQQLN